MNKLFAFLLVALFSFCAIQSNAQVKVGTKPPVVFTYLGDHKDSAAITVEEAKYLLKQPLKFRDSKGNEYKVSSYMFVYKRLVASETEDGRKYIEPSSLGKLFTENPLPQIWAENVAEQLHAGEELLFADVIVKPKTGPVFYAKKLILTIIK